MIPVNEPYLGSRELEYVTDCIRSGWISSAGRYIEEFERKWADYCSMEFGIAVSNGTTALQVAVSCLDFERGAEIIIPTFTIISCALAVIYSGFRPVLVDSDPETWCMDVSQVEEKINSRTRAIMPVHMYGHPVDMDPLRELAEKHSLVIIEDAAEVHGAEYKGRRCGGLGHISVFSFYANKIITTGEGGMVLTNDRGYAEKAKSLRNLCFRPEQRFLHTELGHNFRMTNIQAAIGLAQVERIDELITRKRWIGEQYNRRLADISGICLPVEKQWAKNVYWMYGIVLKNEIDMDAVQLASVLREKGVDTRPFFLGMHEQPVFREMELFIDEAYPIAERLARRGLYLPSGMTLSTEQIEIVCEALNEVLVRA
jgi:perosamine synthetase